METFDSFQPYRDVFAKSLGLEPEQVTRELVQEIRKREQQFQNDSLKGHEEIVISRRKLARDILAEQSKLQEGSS